VAEEADAAHLLAVEAEEEAHSALVLAALQHVEDIRDLLGGADGSALAKQLVRHGLGWGV